MCELCDPKTTKMAKQGHISRAEQLERFASYERAIAADRIKPHSYEMAALRSSAVLLIRFLVEDYL